VVFLNGDVAMSNDRQLRSDSDTYAEIKRRNQIRKQSGLPPLELQQELDRIHQVRQRRAFEQWMRSPLRYRVEQKLLLRVRRRRDNPSWSPTGVLSGGGWAFHATLIKQMQWLRKRLGG
jgi:hypothetical protein